MWCELDWMENRAKLTSNKIAVIDEKSNEAWTYEELNIRAKSIALWLKSLGVKKGDRIALLSPNHISYLDLLFGCGKMGAILVPLNWRLSIHELKGILEDCSPALIGIHLQFHQNFNELTKLNIPSFIVGNTEYEANAASIKTGKSSDKIDENDPLVMIYTGGTTGQPKGVVLSHQSILWNAMNTIVSWDLSHNDVTLTYLPMFHTGGLNALTIPILMSGGKVIIGNQFDAQNAVGSINYHRCTIVLLVPTMYHLIVQTKEFHQSDFPSMKVFLSGGAPCPLDIYEKFQKKGLIFKEGYGLTEAGPNNFYIDPKDVFKKRGSVGKSMLFNTIKLLKSDGHEAGPNEVGELVLKGKHSFSYYWNNEEATRETIKDGWIYTGDLAKKDDEGFHYIIGRKKEMIITGGENVYPLEIEQWLSAHPDIEEVSVLGLPNEKWGEIVTAFIKIKSSLSINEENLLEYCTMKLGKYKIPKRFFILEELPRTHVGKIDKVKLRDQGMDYLKTSKEQSSFSK